MDPGSNADEIANILDGRGWSPIAVINTHAHYDHIGAVADLIDCYGIPFYLHGDDSDLLRRANLYRMVFDSPESVRIPKISQDLKYVSGILEVGPFRLQVMHTPGHTHGSVCFRLDDHLFSGDTLMARGPGRTDLPGGDAEALSRSIDVLSGLDESTQVFGGHGRSVTLGNALSAAETETQGS